MQAPLKRLTLAHVETEHSAESYRTWLQSDIAKIFLSDLLLNCFRA